MTSGNHAALDNPVWHALHSYHASLALGNALAKKYPPRTTPFAAFAEPSDAAWASLAVALDGQRRVGVLLDEPRDPPAGWTVVTANPITQMTWDGGVLPAVTATIEQMTPADVPEMVALAELTKPGPMAERVLELGNYYGVREGSRLAAIAGERIHLTGYTEVSGVCTHPDFRGRGYAEAAGDVAGQENRLPARSRNAVPASQDEQRIRAAGIRIARLPPAPVHQFAGDGAAGALNTAARRTVIYASASAAPSGIDATRPAAPAAPRGSVRAASLV